MGADGRDRGRARLITAWRSLLKDWALPIGRAVWLGSERSRQARPVAAPAWPRNGRCAPALLSIDYGGSPVGASCIGDVLRGPGNLLQGLRRSTATTAIVAPAISRDGNFMLAAYLGSAVRDAARALRDRASPSVRVRVRALIIAFAAIKQKLPGTLLVGLYGRGRARNPPFCVLNEGLPWDSRRREHGANRSFYGGFASMGIGLLVEAARVAMGIDVAGGCRRIRSCFALQGGRTRGWCGLRTHARIRTPPSREPRQDRAGLYSYLGICGRSGWDRPIASRAGSRDGAENVYPDEPQLSARDRAHRRIRRRATLSVACGADAFVSAMRCRAEPSARNSR